MADEDVTMEERFLADFAGTAGADLGRLGGAHEWNQSKWIQNSKTKADVVELVIYANRSIALVQSEITAASLRADLQMAARAS